MKAIYADTSALMKLVVQEQETIALEGWLAATNPLVVTSELTSVELVRAAQRVSVARTYRATSILNEVVRVPLRRDIVDQASRLYPTTVRSLDAIHLATALVLSGDISTVLTYDKQMANAAEINGLTVVAPGV